MNTEIKKLHQQLIKTHKELSLHLGKTYDAGEADAILREMNEVNFRAMMAGRLIFKETTENIDKKIDAVFGYADVRADQPVRRASDRRKRAFVAQELHDRAGVVDQRDAVRRAVLQAVARIVDNSRAETALLIRQDAGQGFGTVRGASAAVVKDDRPPRQVRAGSACDLDRLSGVGARVVVVDLVDEDLSCRGLGGCDGEDGDQRNWQATGTIGHGGVPRESRSGGGGSGAPAILISCIERY